MENEVTDRATVQVRFCFLCFSFSRSPWCSFLPFPVPCFSNILPKTQIQQLHVHELLSHINRPLYKSLLFSQVVSLSLFKLIVTDDSLECYLKPAQNYLASLQYTAFNSILGINSLIHFLPQNFSKNKYSFAQTCPCSTLSANRYLNNYKAPISFIRVIYHDLLYRHKCQYWKIYHS